MVFYSKMFKTLVNAHDPGNTGSYWYLTAKTKKRRRYRIY